MTYPAIYRAGQQTLLVRDDKIIGEGRVVQIVGNELSSIERASVVMTDDAGMALISKTAAAKALGNVRYVYLNFCSSSGLYLGTPFIGHEDNELNMIFKDVMIVDKMNLGLGMVPDTFKNVPGYNSLFFDDLSFEDKTIVPIKS
jgi:hypothetical protein